MKVHVFKGSGSNYGFTNDAQGTNLPQAGGPWKHFKDIDMKPGENRVGVGSDEVLGGIAKEGYYVSGVSIEVREGPAK